MNYEALLNKLDINGLKEVITRAEVSPILDAAFTKLNEKIGDEAFINFCNTI
jgi:hypothetical protein